MLPWEHWPPAVRQTLQEGFRDPSSANTPSVSTLCLPLSHT